MATATTHSRGVRRPEGCSLLQFGSTGAVYEFVDDPTIVAKLPFEEKEYVARLQGEMRILKRLGADQEHGRHPHIVRCIRMEDNDRGGRIILERAEHSALRLYFSETEEGQQVSEAERVQWCRQVTGAVAYIHSKGVIQGDLGNRNVLLRRDRSVCLCDFAGSGIDGERPEVWAQSGFRHPKDEMQGTVAGELHALGSTLYEIVTSRIPHWKEEKAYEAEYGFDGKADELMREGKHPDTTGLPLGAVIAGCWAGEFTTAQAVLDAIDETACEPARTKVVF
ncbi:hypothetical protein SPBR_08900 [Sporothrix brasiliensis 5110]|uniref:Protein kinase domain-containing protein n=1 Tax=Sporothrix brasiliensis 5110 TaxID=1398154 RepID=A0A0C2IN08_9PEZI|nr:uncharacterized protein SPBR_08900 [Sporothrix brasiliensis 5110]KIH86372.1 hypothetical protein SPBR_08900 [Sporothrix brasiliensis 5110]